jgi:DNA-binding CsgD family transcriptional regulator
MATRRSGLRHPDLAARPCPNLLDRLAGPRVRGLHRLEEVQNVLRARSSPQSQEPMVGVRKRPPTADGDEAGVALFGEDHGVNIFVHASADKLPEHGWGTPYPRVVATGDLIGRDEESDVVDSMVGHIADSGGSLLIRGEPGIGKSALLERARRQATALGAQTLTAVGVESEAEFPFAGLHQLLRPILGLASALPDPQRHAIEAAFGVTADARPDLFLVAMAALQILSRAAESAPVVARVDDAHWLDRPSVQVLAFIARRLENEPVVLLAAVRAGYQTPIETAGIRVLDLQRLSPLAAGQLLDLLAPDLHPIMRARVLAEAAGNPLALVELPRTMPHSGLSLAPTTLTARLEQAFATRLRDLPLTTRLVLLAAALDSRASLDEVLAAAHAPLPVVEPAVQAGLVDVGEGAIRFRHPLIRSAVRQAANSQEVLEMYGALAEIVTDGERRLWHRAMAAVGRDEQVAGELERYASAAVGRGAVTAAAAALERAAGLTPNPRVKGHRLVSAAELGYELGLSDVVSRLAKEATQLDVGSSDRARLAWLGEMTSGNVWVEPGAAKTFVTIARQIVDDGGDPDMALRSLVPMAHRAWWTRTRPTTRRYLVEAAQSLSIPASDPRMLAVMALANPEETGPEVMSHVSRVRLHEVPDAIAGMYVGIAAEKSGDFALGARFLSAAVDGLRDQVRLGVLTQALVHYSWAATFAGEWTAAAAAAREGAALAHETGQPQFGLTGGLIGALVSALRGNNPDTDAVSAQPDWSGVAMNGGPLLATAHLARAAAALGEGRHEAAFAALWPVFDEKDAVFHRFMRWPTVLDLVEAAAGSGQLDQVTGVMAELEAIAARSKPAILCAGLSCARPLLAPDAAAADLYEAALSQDLRGTPYLRARTLHSYGRWLRHQRRTAEARTPLRSSVALFDALGATRWSGRARDELRATGESVGRRRPPDARERLTAQELQIAQLAARGLSNREIAERLFVSHRTIGSHLYHIFPKLGITTRSQLRDALRTPDLD